MAFEALARSMASRGVSSPAGPRPRARRLIIAMSIAVHGVAVVAAVAYSYWHIEELAPPTVTVTFVTAAPPPPPPPPAALGGGAGPAAARRKPATPPKVVPPARPSTPEPPKLVAPTVEPNPTPTPPATPPSPAHPEPALQPGPGGPGVPGGVKTGVVGGVAGGLPGGTPGGTGAGPPGVAPQGARFLPPQMGAAQKLSGPDPDFPAVLRATAGMKYSVKAKVCVGVGGSVEGVLILKHGPPMLDASVSAAVKTWRFRPLVANGTPVPFCYFANFDFGTD